MPVFVVRAKKRKAAQAPARPKMVVDTTDDKSVDVYATDEDGEAEALPEPIVGELPEEAGETGSEEGAEEAVSEDKPSDEE